MPFTPFHCGPGLALKAIAPKRFSFCVFAITQVAIDVEVLWHLLDGTGPLHRECHTYVGATFVGAVCFLAGKPVSQWLKAAWNRVARRLTAADLIVPERTTWTASFAGAAIGAYSHVVLDSLTHPYLHPMMPWSRANVLGGYVTSDAVRIFCVLAGLAGIFVLTRKNRAEKEDRQRPNSE